MVLVERRRLDQKTRVHIPSEYIRLAGGHPNGDVYVSFDEQSKEIKIVFPSEDNPTPPKMIGAEHLKGSIAR